MDSEEKHKKTKRKIEVTSTLKERYRHGQEAHTEVVSTLLNTGFL